MAFITGLGLLSPVPFPCQENQVGWDTDQWRRGVTRGAAPLSADRAREPRQGPAPTHATTANAFPKFFL